MARSLVIAAARNVHGRPLTVRALTGPDPAWGAAHAAHPDAVLKPGAHGPLAVFGLDTLRLAAAEAGVHEVDGAPARR